MEDFESCGVCETNGMVGIGGHGLAVVGGFGTAEAD